MHSSLGGHEFLDEQFHDMGLRKTLIRNWLPDLPGTNTISMYEMATLLNNIDNGFLLSQQSRTRAIEILSGTHNRRLLAWTLPPDAIFAHKTGDIGTALADAGIVYMPDNRRSGLKVVREILSDIPGVSFVELTARDVVRHRIVASIVEAYARFESKAT